MVFRFQGSPDVVWSENSISIRLLWLAILVLGLTLLTGPNFALAGSVENGELARKLEAVIDKAIVDSEAPGAIVGVYMGDFAWTKAVGLANVKDNIPMKTSYLWRIGSVTKTFVATAVLRLCDKKLLSLDDRLAKYRPDFPKADRITVRQLLQHSSGIFSWDEDDAVREAILKHPDQDWSMEKLIQLAAKKPFYFEPGSGFHYSNVGYFLLVPVIEKAAGKSVSEVIKEEIVKPLGLKNTYMPAKPHYKEEIIHGYMTENGVLKDVTDLKFADVINFTVAHTAGGLVSTLEDLKVWSKALASGRLLSQKMHEEQMRVMPSSNYGLGVVIYKDWLGHSGGVAGSMCNVYINPKADATIIQYFNKLDAVNLEQNENDLKALSKALLEMMNVSN